MFQSSLFGKVNKRLGTNVLPVLRFAEDFQSHVQVFVDITMLYNIFIYNLHFLL